MKLITNSKTARKVMAAVIGLCAAGSLAIAGTGSLTDLKAKSGRDDVSMMRQRRNPLAAKSQSPALLQSGRKTSAQQKLPGSNTVLCGIMVYNDLWGQTDGQGNYIYPITAGVYTFEAKPGGQIKKVKEQQDMIKIRAGVKVNNLYYAISTSNSDTEAALSTYYTSSWSRRSTSEIDIVNVPADMTYDPKTGNVYGFFWNDEYQQYDRFCRFDTYYGEAQDIVQMERNCFAIAANAEGEIYGIMGYTGWLVRVWPSTGKYEYIGKTGFAPGYTNSMTFDDATGKLYWAANAGDGESWLLEVDPATGAAKELYQFPDNASFAGIFAMPYKVPDAAPAAVTDLEVSFTAPGSNTATVSCTAPDKTYNGASLEGPLTVAFTAGTAYCEVENVNPGAKVESVVMTLPSGEVKIEAVAATEALLGAEASMTCWVGEDVPGAPENVTLTSEDGVPTLSWTAPEVGAHGGLLNPEGLTYTITRLPEKKTFTGISGTSWKDEDFAGGTTALQYTIKAVNSAGESPEVTSERMVFGEAFTVPFMETFSTADDFSLWTVFDLNGQTTWEYDAKGGAIFYSYSKDIEIPGDDWIISPRIRMEAGKTYQLSADAKSYYKGYPENFRFALGRQCSPGAMTQTILEREEFANTKGETVRAIFTVEESGEYHLGLYDYSIAHNWQLTIDNISIIEVSDRLPGAVSDLNVTPADRGESKATITFRMPSTDAAGNELEETLSANIYRDHSQNPVMTLSDLSPGGEASWIDETPGEAGMHHYRVVAVNSIGEGADNAMERWIGMDIPGAVTDLKEKENADGSVTLTWTAPAAGAHGGYFGDSPLTYRVICSDGRVVEDAATGTTVTDSGLGLARQELLYYLVTPYAGEVKGQYNNTDYEVYGPAYASPFAETFPNADMAKYPWVSESDAPVHLWTLETTGLQPVASDHNGDQGMAMFSSPELLSGKTGRLAGPKVDLSGLASPEFSFWMYHTATGAEGEGETLRVLVSCDGEDFQPVEGAEWKRNDGTSGWQLHSVSLAPYATAQWIRPALEATAAGVEGFYVDDIRIDNAKAIDLAVTAVEIPSRTAPDVELPAEVTVSNLGNADASGITLKVMEGEKEIASRSVETLAAGKEIRIELPVTLTEQGTKQIAFAVSAADDADESNDKLEREVKVVDLVIPGPKMITYTMDQQIPTLRWEFPGVEAEVKDDMESYRDWAINGIGDYTMVDMDGDVTYYINKDLGQYPDCSTPKAFQVCNAKTLGIDIWDEGTPHSGNKMLMAMANVNLVNDDWMILPRLNGAGHYISFYAKAFTADDTPAERFRVLASSSDKAPASFTLVGPEYEEVPDQWTQYSYYVPEGTKWVAINCVSDGAFALFIDDVCYNDFTVHTGQVKEYNVYRNGEKIATAAMMYTDYAIPEGQNRYQISAVYEDGKESPLSDEILVAYSGVEEVEAATEFAVRSEGNALIVTNATGRSYSIINAEGSTVATGSGSGSHQLPSGVYIVRTSESTVKIMH